MTKKQRLINIYKKVLKESAEEKMRVIEENKKIRFQIGEKVRR